MTAKTPKPEKAPPRKLSRILMNEYLVKRLRGCSDKSKYNHEHAIDLFHEYLKHPPTVEDLTDDQIVDFAHWLVNEKKNAIPTANKSAKMLVALWNFAAKQGHIKRWPSFRKLREPKRVPIAWTREQLQRLFRECQNTTEDVFYVPAPLWWNAIHSFIWDTGERIGAVLQVRWSDVDLDSRWVNIRAETRKWKTEDKGFLLHPNTVEALRAIQTERQLVFAMKIDSPQLYYYYRRIIKAAGLPMTRKHKFHCMRKSAASYFEAAGGNATELLGHSSRDVTKAYLDPRIVQQVHAADLLFRPVDTGAGGS